MWARTHACHTQAISFNQVIVGFDFRRRKCVCIVVSIENPLVILRRSKLNITHELIRRTMSTKKPNLPNGFPPINGRGRTTTSRNQCDNDADRCAEFKNGIHSMNDSRQSAALSAPFAFNYMALVNDNAKTKNQTKQINENDAHTHIFRNICPSSSSLSLLLFAWCFNCYLCCRTFCRP